MTAVTALHLYLCVTGDGDGEITSAAIPTAANASAICAALCGNLAAGDRNVGRTRPVAAADTSAAEITACGSDFTAGDKNARRTNSSSDLQKRIHIRFSM